MKHLVLVSCLLLGNLAFAGKTLKVVKGVCKLEGSQEIVELTNKDPNMHFGLFAEGFTSKKDRIYLASYGEHTIEITIQSTRGMGSTVVDTHESGLTTIRLGVLMQENEPSKSEWLSCHLVVEGTFEGLDPL